MIKDEITRIINQHLFPKTGCVHQQVAPPGKLEAISEAIAELVQSQPVDRVAAMAALIHALPNDYYLVPDGLGSVCTVWQDDDGKLRCPGTHCRSSDTCDHTRAVELYRERQ